MKTLSYKEGEFYKEVAEQPTAIEPTLKKLKDYKQEPPKPLPKEEKNEEIKKFNQDPRTKVNKVRAIKKGTFWFLIILITILSLALLINVFWFNISFASGKMQGNVTVNNDIQVNTPDVPVTVEADVNNYNNHTINIDNNLEIDEDFADDMIDEIIEGVLEGLNETG